MSRKRRGSRRGRAAASSKKRGTGRAAARLGGELTWAAALTAIAFLERLFFLLSNRDRDWPYTIFYEGDARSFFLWTRAMLEGRLYDEGIPYHPPGFALFSSALHVLLGVGEAGAQVPHRTVKILLALIASFAVGLLFLLARPYVSRFVAALGALLLAFHFGHAVISIAPVSEGLYTTLLLAALLLWSRRLEHPLSAPRPEAAGAPGDRRRGVLLAGFGLGLLGGALALLRFESVLIFALLLATGLWTVFRLWRRRDLAADRAEDSDDRPRGQARDDRAWRRALAPWLLAAAGWALVVAPWTVRNHLRLSDYNERMGERLAEPLPTFVPVTIYGPINLALANQDRAEGSFSPEALTGWTGGASLDLTLEKHLEWMLHGDRLAWRWMRENPGDFASLVLRKWRLSLEVFKLGFTQWNLPGGLVGVRRPVDLFVPDSSPGWWLWPLLIVAGAVLAWRRPEARRFLLLTLLVSSCWLVSTGLFFGYVRLALLYLPLWAVLAALPLVELGRQIGRRLPIAAAWWRGLGVAAVAALLIAGFAGSDDDRNYRASASSTVDGHHLNPDDEIRLEVIADGE